MCIESLLGLRGTGGRWRSGRAGAKPPPCCRRCRRWQLLAALPAASAGRAARGRAPGKTGRRPRRPLAAGQQGRRDVGTRMSMCCCWSNEMGGLRPGGCAKGEGCRRKKATEGRNAAGASGVGSGARQGGASFVGRGWGSRLGGAKGRERMKGVGIWGGDIKSAGRGNAGNGARALRRMRCWGGGVLREQRRARGAAAESGGRAQGWLARQ